MFGHIPLSSGWRARESTRVLVLPTDSGRSNSGTNVAAVLLFAPGYLLINGRDVVVDKGKEVTAYVDQDTFLVDPKNPMPTTAAPPPLPSPVTALASGMTLFTLTDGSQFVRALQGFDGTTYTVSTPTGSRSVPAGSLSSMKALGTAPATVSPSPTPVVPAPVPAPSAVAAPPVIPPPVAVVAPPPPAPRLPIIKTFPQKARLEMTNGNSYFGSVTAFYETTYNPCDQHRDAECQPSRCEDAGVAE